MVRLLRQAAACLCGILAAAAQAEISATLSPPAIKETETTRLTLRVDGASSAINVDVSPLEADFEVLGINTASHFRSINGQVQRWVEYRIDLRPKIAGPLSVPPLNVGGSRSPPLRLQVDALGAEVRSAIDQSIFFEAQAAPNPVHVQAQTVLTRRLFYAAGVQVHSDLPGVPALTNAVVVPLGDDTTSTATRHGKTYGVLEQRYAIFPEDSGVLRIPEISVISSVRLPGRTGDRRSGIHVSAPATTVQVLSIPDEYPANKPWWPAEDVSIVEQWRPEAPIFEVGEPLRRTISIEVVGNTGSSVPPLALALPAEFFKQYPEPAQMNDGATASGTQGSRREAQAIIPIHPGTATLPQVSLTWWDTAAGRVRETVLPARQVQITGEAPTVATAPPPTRVQVGAGPQDDKAGAPPPTTVYTHPTWLLALTAFGFLGWALTWGTAYAKRRTKSPMPDDDGAIAARRAWKALEQACRKHDLESMRNAWLAYMAAHWQTSVADTLARIKASAPTQALLDQLNRGLYANAPTTGIDGPELLKSTRALVDQHRREKPPPLPELESSPS